MIGTPFLLYSRVGSQSTLLYKAGATSRPKVLPKKVLWHRIQWPVLLNYYDRHNDNRK